MCVPMGDFDTGHPLMEQLVGSHAVLYTGLVSGTHMKRYSLKGVFELMAGISFHQLPMEDAECGNLIDSYLAVQMIQDQQPCLVELGDHDNLFASSVEH